MIIQVSPNTVARFAKDNPYHFWIELNATSIVYFPLSPKYCLEITPFEMGTPLDINAYTMDIKFEYALPHELILINEGILYTTSNVIISNTKESLDNYVKIE